jgi:hypothetical protein
MDRTVEEAKTMICPMSLSGSGGFQWKNCYADKCMAWRWKKIAANAKDKTLKGHCAIGEGK